MEVKHKKIFNFIGVCAGIIVFLPNESPKTLKQYE